MRPAHGLADMTEIKELLKTNELVFAKAMTSMLLIDQAGTIYKMNKYAERTFKCKFASMADKCIDELLPQGPGSSPPPSDLLPEVRFRTSLRRARFFSLLKMGSETEIEMKRADGQRRTCVARINDLQAGEKTLFVVCITGRLDRRKRERKQGREGEGKKGGLGSLTL